MYGISYNKKTICSGRSNLLSEWRERRGMKKRCIWNWDKKKKIDCSSAEFLTIDEGLCVQIMHLGSFDDEPATVVLMDEYLKQNGYANDMNSQRLHHEIYLSDARKVAPEKWKTVIRHPIRKI